MKGAGEGEGLAGGLNPALNIGAAVAGAAVLPNILLPPPNRGTGCWAGGAGCGTELKLLLVAVALNENAGAGVGEAKLRPG